MYKETLEIENTSWYFDKGSEFIKSFWKETG